MSVCDDDDTRRWMAGIEAVLHQNPWFSVLQQEVIRADGSSGTHFTIHHPRSSVGIIAKRDKRYLLIRQHRFIIDQFVWAIPSGNIDPSETAAEAAARELLEETGLKATTLRHLLHYFPTYGCSDQRFELFITTDPEQSEQMLDQREVIRIQWFHQEEIVGMITKNDIVDGLSLVPLMYAIFLDNKGY
jgi:ADP-ribose pyrophosphatase